jgi:hypothetical protein
VFLVLVVINWDKMEIPSTFKVDLYRRNGKAGRIKTVADQQLKLKQPSCPVYLLRCEAVTDRRPPYAYVV